MVGCVNVKCAQSESCLRSKNSSSLKTFYNVSNNPNCAWKIEADNDLNKGKALPLKTVVFNTERRVRKSRV